MSPRDLPIGIFDSGVGGLTVLRALRAALPAEDFLYLGDTARVPYGTRSPETVCRYARQAAELLFQRGIKALVVACNTASAAALDALRETHPDFLIEGVIEPGAQAALAATSNERIAVIATEGTVRGNAYPRAVARLNPHAHVEQRACALLVALAEEGWTDGAVVDAALARYFADLFPGPDVLLLGCTHFPVLEDAIRAAIPSDVQLVNSAATTATVVAEDLQRRGLRRPDSMPEGVVHYLVTDNLARFERTAANFLGVAPAPGTFELVDLAAAAEKK